MLGACAWALDRKSVGPVGAGDCFAMVVRDGSGFAIATDSSLSRRVNLDLCRSAPFALALDEFAVPVPETDPQARASDHQVAWLISLAAIGSQQLLAEQP